MSEIFSLKGKIAIITGASGGIGHILSLGLAEHGADVVLTSRTLSKLEPIAEEIRDMGRKALAISTDVSSEKSVDNMVEQVAKEFGHIDILVNCAGLNLRYTAEEFPLEEWRKVIDFNIQGTFICCQRVGRKMIEQGHGKIVNISSVRGRYGAAQGAAAYSPSKGAVDSLTRTLAAEWAKYGINVNAIAPTIVETELTRPLFENKELIGKLVERVPLGRFGIPEDMVGTMVFLASKASEYITGQIIYVDGGTTSC